MPSSSPSRSTSMSPSWTLWSNAPPMLPVCVTSTVADPSGAVVIRRSLRMRRLSAALASSPAESSVMLTVLWPNARSAVCLARHRGLASTLSSGTPSALTSRPIWRACARPSSERLRCVVQSPISSTRSVVFSVLAWRITSTTPPCSSAAASVFSFPVASGASSPPQPATTTISASRQDSARRTPSTGGGGERAGARELLRDVLVGVVARAHERARGDVVEAELVRSSLERLELVRVPIAHDRQVALGRAQVLADGEHLDSVLAQLPERVDQLVVRLAEPDHQARLRRHLVAAHRLRVGEHAQRALPGAAAPRDRVEPRHDLDIVVEDVRALGDHLCERHLLAAEVGREALDLAPGSLHADRADHAAPDAGAVVGQVVAVDRRDDRVTQAHAGD